MAITFGRSTLSLATGLITSTGALVYTCPTTASSVTIMAAQVANVDGSNAESVDFALDVGGAGTTIRYYAKDLNLATGAAINLLGGNHVLAPNDKLRARSDTPSGADLIVSYTIKS